MNFFQTLLQICRPVRAGVIEDGCRDTPNFGRSLDPISTRGADYVVVLSPIPFGFSNLPTALICKYMNNILKIVKYTAFWCHVSKWTVCLCGTVGNGRGEGSVSPSSFCQIYQPYSNQGGQNLPAKLLFATGFSDLPTALLKVALSPKRLEDFYFSKINIPNYYLEQKI